jgi:hypothetical protein
MPNERVFSGQVEPQGRGEEPFYYFTRVYLLFLQGLFNALPEGSYRWSADEGLTEIAITDQVPIPRETIEKRPALVTMRGPGQFANLSLDQMRSINLRTGAKERTDLVSCTMTINAIAKNGVEAQRIAWIVMRHLRTFKTMLQRVGGMHKVGDEISIGPESAPGSMVGGEADPSWVMVSVYSPFFFQWTEIDEPSNASLFSSVEATLKSALLPLGQAHPGGMRTYGAQVSPPTIRGRIIDTQEARNLRVGVITQKVKT